MRYRIVGHDGKVYGPVELAELRQWLAAGRVERRTPVHVEGAAEWTTIGALPELAMQTAGAPPTIASAPSAPAARGTNSFAIWGLVCAILSWMCCCCPFNLLGIIFCIIALVQISGQAQPQEGRAFAITGLVLCGLNLLASVGFGMLQMAMNPGSIEWQIQ